MSQNNSEILQTDLATWNIGPYHQSLPAPMQLKLQLDGEIIVGSAIETGFLHRGLEKALERQQWTAAISYADRLDPENAAAAELALCLAAEEVAQIPVPPRAQRIRTVLCEMGRITSHMSYIINVARAVGSETMLHYVLRDRETLLDQVELLTGARYSLNFMRFGGVKNDVTEGFIERILEICELIRIRLKEYNDLFTYNHAFLGRTRNIGGLSINLIDRYGVTGPNARASGSALDLRKVKPYNGYEYYDFHLCLGQTDGQTPGSAHDRFVIRLREMAESVVILKQALESIPEGAFCSTPQGKAPPIPQGEAYARVESPRGILGCHVVSDGSNAPWRVQFRPPTYSNLQALPHLLQGVRVEDIAVLLASLDLGIAEADR